MWDVGKLKCNRQGESELFNSEKYSSCPFFTSKRKEWPFSILRK